MYLYAAYALEDTNLMNAFWQKVKNGAKVVGDFQARLLLGILYVLLVLPTGLIVKLGGDLLEIRPPDKTISYWKARPADSPLLRPARRQG
jgi:hypothetical protein